MTTGKTPLTAVRIPGTTLAQIDEWGRQRGYENRSDAIRQLIERGLAAGPSTPEMSALLEAFYREDRERMALLGFGAEAKPNEAAREDLVERHLDFRTAARKFLQRIDGQPGGAADELKAAMEALLR